MATSGTLNVVCHGTIVFVVGNDGSIDLWMPRVDPVWDHRWQAGTWTGKAIDSLVPGEEYVLNGVRPGSGEQHFDPNVNICLDGPAVPAVDVSSLRRLRLPPPKSISSTNVIPMSPKDIFENPDDPSVSALQSLALLHVLSYDCDDLNSVRLVTGADSEAFNWVPQILTYESADGPGPHYAVNLHVFAEPWTFGPLATSGAFPSATTPFNVLIKSLVGATHLTMKPPVPGDSSFIDIDPGSPIAGLPEPEKLVLSQHAQFQRSGALFNHDHPYNCGPVIVRTSGGTTGSRAIMERTAAPPAPARGFAILRNKTPKVLANPEVALIHWGSQAADPKVDEKVKQLLGLSFVKNALEEYGIAAPQMLGSFANPDGSKTKMKDARLFPATISDSPIAAGLKELISAGKIPDPQKHPDILYLIVAAPGASSATPGVTGSHNYFNLDSASAPITVRYAWALQGQPGDPAPLDKLTWTLSHELLEACTDPEPPLGYVFQGPEICDIAKGLHGTVDGIVVTGYFSHRDGVFKIPGAVKAKTA